MALIYGKDVLAVDASKSNTKGANKREENLQVNEKLEAMASWSLLPAILRWNSLAWRNAKNGKIGGMDR